nr:MAG TPA_asm: hypothetical protein [Caudoviricetes sp.]
MTQQHNSKWGYKPKYHYFPILYKNQNIRNIIKHGTIN